MSHFYSLLQLEQLVHQLPSSDLFLLFCPPQRPANKFGMPLHQVEQNILQATVHTMVATEGTIGSVHAIKYEPLLSIFKANVGGEAVNINLIVDAIFKAGRWKGYQISNTDVLKTQVEHRRRDDCYKHDPYSLLFLQCIGFITHVLYPMRTSE